MPNIAKVLREEISRISRHEAKVAVTPVRKSNAKVRPDVAALKNRAATLEKEVKRLNIVVINLVSAQPAPAAAPVDDKVRILGRGVKSLRRKLGLTQEELGKLTGVSLGGVRAWERQKGMLKLKDTSKAAIIAIKGIGKTEARKRLDAMKSAKKVVAKARKVSKGGKVRRRRK
jgi:DNA-binding transcriptional regulator YiaG